MPRYGDYRCAACNQKTDRLRLFAKKISFYALSSPTKIVRSRVQVWLCNTCLELDEDWNAEAYSGPGHTSPSLENARSIRSDVK